VPVVVGNPSNSGSDKKHDVEQVAPGHYVCNDCDYSTASTNYQKIVDWHKRFNVPAPAIPLLPPVERQLLRVTLIREELDELIMAMGQGDLIETADAIGDLLYVVYGTAAECGIDADKVFAEVHRSNMTKDASVVREDGKIMKGPNFSPPDLREALGIVKAQVEA
jgi:predicted HAD superfamily Cof-like phosphohydrolase